LILVLVVSFHIHNMSLDTAIATLVSRLESVTQRLETVEKQLASGAPAAASAASSGGASSGASGADSASVLDFDKVVSEFFTVYLDSSNKLGGEVKEQAALVQKAVAAQRDLLITAASSKQPEPDQLLKLIEPLNKIMAQVVELRDKNRTSKFFNNLSTASEGIAALSWVVVTPTPGPHVADMRAGSEFYSNRILKDFRGKDEVQTNFVHGFNGFLKELQNYIKQHHTTGLTWNSKGGDASAAKSGGPPAPPKGGLPPPPPVSAAPAGAPAPDMNGLFAQLNKGEGISSGLKKVTKDMKTKNIAGKSSVVPAAAVAPKAEKAPAGGKKVGPPKLSLEGNKWVVQNQVNNKDIVISETEPKQTVYIYGCVGSTIVVKGKVNSIVLDECTKTAIVFDSAIATLEVVKCKSVEVQCTGRVPSFAVDMTSGIQLYLSKDSLESEIVTSKSSEMNVLLPGANANDDMIELPLPEQYKTTIKGNKLVTECVQHV